ncbi:MAG TPA: DUF4249 domain-containing protein [Chitinophagaceae bacterium]|nr:DUF4249 domain-containing protein [Chitinophagaceae bacterium]
MMTRLNCSKYLTFITAAILVFSCKEKYTPPAVAAANTDFLVVEGYINVGNDTTTITLSHTRSINDSTPVLAEPGATVVVQNDAGDNYTLTDQGDGRYQLPAIPGNPSAKYRLAITTPDGKEFVSDFVENKQSPAIDSVSWEQLDDGVHIYVNTHDDAAKTVYYKWDYIETYEYNAPFESFYQEVNGSIIPRPYNELIYTCWRTIPSTGIFTLSTQKLARDDVYKNPLILIPASTQKLGVLYSVIVKQYALTEEGYNYWLTLSKNTENLGTLFDPQPSQVQGNIHCINDPSATALGFITASTLQQQRIFISKHQLNDWQYPPDALSICDTVHLNDENTQHYIQAGYLPVNYYEPFMFYAALPDCIDCRRQGGTTIKPPFWP